MVLSAFHLFQSCSQSQDKTQQVKDHQWLGR
jgi:hypothetical protein